MISIVLLLVLLLLAGCIDRSQAIQLCADKGLQYTGKVLTKDIQCVNSTSGQLYIFYGEYDIRIKGD